MQLLKYHGLGNDYLVLSPGQLNRELTGGEIRILCHRNFGVGSDGILLGPLPSEKADFKLRIFNPDGSEAEKSGNGLRIFCSYLFHQGMVSQDRVFTVETVGGLVRAQVFDGGQMVRVSMGTVSFRSRDIPVVGDDREVLQEEIAVGGRTFRFCGATIGNPHCVILVDTLDASVAKTIGPLIEQESRFSNRTNVQFLKVLDRNRIQIEIWERGAGYTFASGSSSCAAAAVARRLGLCDREITVVMPGGELNLIIEDDFAVEMVGPVQFVATVDVPTEVLSASLRYLEVEV